MLNFDREEIIRTWNIYRQPGEVLELRVPKAGKYRTISGYFNDPTKLADAVIGLTDENITGIYFTINPVNPTLFDRASNKYIKWAKNTTCNEDIVSLHWLPIDLDAKRPSGISSTDEEHEAALDKAEEIREWLVKDQGWSKKAFVWADSGNGGHLSVKIDLPNLPENVDLLEDCLKALAIKFPDDKVQIDESVFNPARIWKLYGTVARKGENAPTRPHRMATLLEVPSTFETISKEQLEALVATILPTNQENKSTSSNIGGKKTSFDPRKYAEEHGANVTKVMPWTDRSGGQWELALLEECPFNSSHINKARIGVRLDGAKSFACFEDECKDKKWKALKALWEGDKNQYCEEETPELSLDEIEKTFQENPDNILSFSSIKALRKLSDFSLEGFLKKLKITGDQKKILLNKINPIVEDQFETDFLEKPFSERVVKIGDAIIRHGNCVKFLTIQAQRNHIGDTGIIKHLLASIASTNSLTSAGIQPAISGDKGQGKTDAARAVLHLVPPEWKEDTSISAKAPYYIQWRDGLIVFSDDVEWSTELIHTLKRG